MECLRARMMVKAALSCTCAGDCLVRLGLRRYARQIYREAGRLYLENADAVAGSSVRELLWSLREGYQLFSLSDENQTAAEVRMRFSVISKRVDPFLNDEQLRLQLPEAAKLDLDTPDTNIQLIQGGSDVAMEIEQFLLYRRTGQYQAASQKEARLATIKSNRGKPSNEKSIVNQLG
jgi:hypothetical protein